MRVILNTGNQTIMHILIPRNYYIKDKFSNPQESDEQEGLVGRVRERGAGVARPLVLDLVDGPEAAARRHQRRLRPVRPRPLLEQGRKGKTGRSIATSPEANSKFQLNQRCSTCSQGNQFVMYFPST